MKIEVADLEPNLFRKMNNYPIDRAKVEALKTSIKEKTFWDNILVRKHGNKYELAYGHHRWVALKELGIKEIDVPVRDIDDATMVKIMAEENLNWSTSPAVMTQTILVAKEFLDAELAKYETWEKVPGDFAKNIIETKESFNKIKAHGVGRDTLVKFLGGNWSGYKVRTALDIIKDKDLDQQVVRTIPTMEQARVFRASVKQHKIPKSTQKKIAEKITKEGIGRRDIPDLVAEHSVLPTRKEKAEPKQAPMLDDFVKEVCGLMATLYAKLHNIKGNYDNIQSRRLRETFMRDGKELNELMLEVFGNGTEKKKKKRILSNTCKIDS